MDTLPLTEATPLTKADLGKRFGAALIDVLLVVGVVGILGAGGHLLSGIGTLVGAAYVLLRDGLPVSFADGRSVGKQLLGLRVARLDGGPMTPEASARRNWTLALGSLVSGAGSVLWGLGLGILGGGLVAVGTLAGLLGVVEAVLVLVDADGRRLGDKTGGTQVVG